MINLPSQVAKATARSIFYQFCKRQWDQASFVHRFSGPDDWPTPIDSHSFDPGQDGPRFSRRATSIATSAGGGYSRSTYDGYGAGSIDGVDEVVDVSIPLHRTMVWLRIYCGCTISYPDLHGRGNMVLNATTKSGHSSIWTSQRLHCLIWEQCYK